MSADLNTITVAVVAACYFANVLGLLEWAKPTKKTATEAAAELSLKEQTIERLRRERNEARDEKAALANVQFIEPILTQLHENARLQSEVLDRLVHHNGSFKHMETSLREIAEGLKLATGFIAGLVDLPLRHQPPN